MPKQLWVKNKSDLARKLEISRITLNRLWLLKGHPIARSDGKHNLADWIRFRDANLDITKQSNRKNGAHVANGQFDPAQFSLRTEVETSKIERNKIAARKAAFELDVQMGEYIPREAANRQVDTANAVVVREISKAINNELPPRLEGLSAVEIKKLLGRKFESIFKQLPKHFEHVRNGA